MKQTKKYVQLIKKFSEKLWYPPFIGLLAALDNIVVVIPNDGVLISSTMLAPKRWISFALNMAVGSMLGAMLLATITHYYGTDWIIHVAPGIQESKTWIWTEHFFETYGLIVVFLAAASPLITQPAIILASLYDISLTQLAFAILAGRILKYLLLAYLSSHAPRLLNKLWGIKGEMEEVGVKIKDT